jgi:hypothetical protein
MMSAGTLPDWLGSLENLEVLNLGSQAKTNTQLASCHLLIKNLLLPLCATYKNSFGRTLEPLIKATLYYMSAGTLPDWLGSLENLEVLNLGSQAGTTEETGLHGTIPPSIGELAKLRELNLVSSV